MGCSRALVEGRRRVVRVGGIHLRWGRVVRREVEACWVGGGRPCSGRERGRGAFLVGSGLGGVGVLRGFDRGDWVDFDQGRGCDEVVCQGWLGGHFYVVVAVGVVVVVVLAAIAVVVAAAVVFRTTMRAVFVEASIH